MANKNNKVEPQGEENPEKVKDNLNEPEDPAVEKTPPEPEPQPKKEKPAEGTGGFCVYLGPSIHGAILSGTIFSTDKKTTLANSERILKDYPLIADLIVPGDILPESRIKVKTPGNLLYMNYNKLVGILKTGGK